MASVVDQHGSIDRSGLYTISRVVRLVLAADPALASKKSCIIRYHVMDRNVQPAIASIFSLTNLVTLMESFRVCQREKLLDPILTCRLDS